MILSDVVNAVEALAKVMEVKMKAKVSFELALLHDELKIHNELFIKEREKLFKKFGSEVDGQIQVAKEHMEELTKEMEELLTTEVSIVKKIAIKDLEDIETEFKNILMLKPFISNE